MPSKKKTKKELELNKKTKTKEPEDVAPPVKSRIRGRRQAISQPSSEPPDNETSEKTSSEEPDPLEVDRTAKLPEKTQKIVHQREQFTATLQEHCERGGESFSNIGRNLNHE